MVYDRERRKIMEKVLLILGGGVVTIGGIFLLVVFGTLIGAISGWVVGLFFSETILGILSQFGVSNVAMWEFGAFLGFVGGFLKTKVAASDND